jgi:Uma2 family endonuclease
MLAEPAYVPTMSPATPITAEEFLSVSIPGKRVELVRGVLLVREPAGLPHGRITLNLARRLADHAETRHLGAPDIAFIRHERIPTPEPAGFPDMAPDLAVEVLSPGNRPGEVLGKIADWLSAGTRLVWVIDPERRVARTYHLDGTEAVVSADDALRGEDVLPGFVCSLSAIL